MSKYSVGIDVSKETLDICVYDGESRQYFQACNNEKTFNSEILKRLSEDLSLYHFVMEVTGIYHLRLAMYLHQSGLKVSVVNPLIIRRYSEMKLRRHKTDASDSLLIAEYGFKEHPSEFSPKSEILDEMEQMLKAIEDYHVMTTDVKNRLESLKNRPHSNRKVVSLWEKQLSSLRKSVKELEGELEALVGKHFKPEDELLRSIPGIGKRVATAIISMLNSFKSFESPKQVCSYLGINPTVFESGSSVRGSGRIPKKGNRYLRKLLFLASLSAKRFNKSCAELFDRLIHSGKAKKQALMAVANKLIRQAFGVIKSGNQYNPDYA